MVCEDGDLGDVRRSEEWHVDGHIRFHFSAQRVRGGEAATHDEARAVDSADLNELGVGVGRKDEWAAHGIDRLQVSLTCRSVCGSARARSRLKDHQQDEGL